MIINNKFLDYDMRLLTLKDNYLIEASLLYELHEANPQQQNTQASSDWYIRWKANTVMTFKNSFAQAQQYASKMNTKYFSWLKTNKEYFDPTKYGVPAGCTLSKAPDYRQAILRIKEPLANALNGISLDNISAGDDESDGNNTSNRWFMKYLIKSYDGTGEDFAKFAKDYYAGNDNLNTINTHDMIMYIPIMYNFCLGYDQLMHNLESQLNTIISYINLDPISGQQNPSNSAETQMAQLQQKKANNQMASTNPQQNIVHAAADYLLMRESYMMLNEYNTIQQEATAAPTVNTNTTNMVQQGNMVKSGASVTTNQQHNFRQNSQTPQTQNQVSNQINQKQLLMKKKQTAVNIIKDCFSSKVTAAGMIYRDFISTLQTYIYGIQQRVKRNNEAQAKSIKNQTNKKPTKDDEE